MKITEFNTEYIDEKDRLGLKAFKMSKLGNVVLLAGKNGSGKSRALQLLRQQANDRQNYFARRRNLSREITDAALSVQNLQQMFDQCSRIPEKKDDLVALKEQIDNLTQKKGYYESEYKKPFPIDIGLSENETIKIVDYVPKRVELKDWRNLPQYEWKQNAKKAEALGCHNLYESSLSLIQNVYDRYWNTSHQHFHGENGEKERANEDLNRLQGIVKRFLEVSLDRNADGEVTLFDKPIAQAQLSDGQKILLQLCVAIYAQGAKISDYILVMDEPENHLHPSAVIEMIDKIRELNPEGQIWIATHSIALLSHFDPSCIWYVKDGSVSYSGRKPEQVLEGLLGNEENIQRLHSFIDLPDEFATNRFAFECLLPPGVADSDVTDPQFGQLKEILESIWSGGKEKISLLDYGAGKGRMISNLSENSRINTEMLDYVAFDEYDANKNTCIKNIECFYSDAEIRYFNTMEGLRTKRDDKSFDLILMCNVLHEIPHNRWIPLFKDLKRLLKDDGKLLLIEDCKIPVGELPHQKGFIVLNSLHLKDLFAIPASEQSFIANDARPDSEPGRLMAHLIPACYLDKITNQTMQTAFDDLRATSIRNIKQIRMQKQTYKNGMAHAFWTQQLANATLCLEEMG